MGKVRRRHKAWVYAVLIAPRKGRGDARMLVEATGRHVKKRGRLAHEVRLPAFVERKGFEAVRFAVSDRLMEEAAEMEFYDRLTHLDGLQVIVNGFVLSGGWTNTVVGRLECRDDVESFLLLPPHPLIARRCREVGAVTSIERTDGIVVQVSDVLLIGIISS